MSMNFGPEGPPSFENTPPEEEKEEQAPGSSPERQEFTPEEVEELEGRAEETMTETQKELSERREISAEALRDLGVEGYLYVTESERLEQKFGGYTGGTSSGGDIKTITTSVEGQLNNHDVKLQYEHSEVVRGHHLFPKPDDGYEGTIDGTPLTPKDARRLYSKYVSQSTAINESVEDRAIQEANLEAGADTNKDSSDILRDSGLL